MRYIYSSVLLQIIVHWNPEGNASLQSNNFKLKELKLAYCPLWKTALITIEG